MQEAQLDPSVKVLAETELKVKDVPIKKTKINNLTEFRSPKLLENRTC